VKFWEEAIKINIRLTKIRVIHMEKHGIGKSAMDEKSNLVKSEKKLKDWRIENK